MYKIEFIMSYLERERERGGKNENDEKIGLFHVCVCSRLKSNSHLLIIYKHIFIHILCTFRSRRFRRNRRNRKKRGKWKDVDESL